MMRASRSTQAATLAREVAQAALIARAMAEGAAALAEHLTDCQRARIWRTPEMRFRCRSAACHACRRSAMTRWWHAIASAWSERQYTTVRLSGLIWPRVGSPAAPLRRRLRDWRDKLALQKPKYQSAGFAGFQTGDRAILFVQHAGINSYALLNAFSAKWDVEVISTEHELNTHIAPDQALQVGMLKRGVEPLRVIVMPRLIRFISREDVIEPMPSCW